MIVFGLLVGPGAVGQDPGWVIDPAGYQSSMTVTGALVVDGWRSTSADDRVAAFAGGEIRGVTTPIEVGGRMTFFLTVYGNIGGEEVHFKAYLSGADRVLGTTETLPFAANAVHGTVSAPFLWNVNPLGGCERGRPGWTINPSAFQSSMSVTAAVDVDTGSEPGSGDMLAAFAGEELRGVTAPVAVGNGWRFFLTVYANTSQEPITFRLYQAATDAVYVGSGSLSFDADAVTGTPNSPFTMTAACPATATAVEPQAVVPVYDLLQVAAYPNPFRDTATLSYTLSVPARVYVSVHDLWGRTLHRWDEGMTHTGAHHVQLDAADLPSGVYVYRISTGASHFTGRITRVR